MVIKLLEYDGKYRVVSFAKSLDAKRELECHGLSLLFWDNNKATIYPEDLTFDIDEASFEAVNDLSDYDVFEISDKGTLFRRYNASSSDNVIVVTNSCNSNCIMCPTSETIRRGHETYNAAELIEIIKHFPSDASHITITGGEPLLIKRDFFTVLEYLKNSLIETEYLLLTNGRAFCSNEYIDLFIKSRPKHMLLGIPIHGHNAELHDYITQSAGSFHQTMTGLKHLLHIETDVELRIVVSKLNADYITDIADLIIQEIPSVRCVKVIGLEMTGSAAVNREKVWLDYPTAFKKSKDGIDKLIKAGIDVGIYNFPLCSVEKGYWNICEKSISEHKVRYYDKCDDCYVKDACGGLFLGSMKLAEDMICAIEKYD